MITDTILPIPFTEWASAIRMLPYDRLPGLAAQLRMAPKMREAEIRSMGADKAPKPGSVLFLIFAGTDGSACTALIKRPQYNGAHSGQISFPGGKAENSDLDYCFTALREANEELGIEPQEVEVTGQLTDLFIPPSNFLVKTFIGLSNTTPKFRPSPSEVEQLIVVPITAFFRPENILNQTLSLSNGYRISTPCYKIGSWVIWGATAMIISEFTCLATEFFGSRQQHPTYY